MRLSFNANAHNLGNPDYFYGVLKEIRPTSVVVMDNINVAENAYNALDSKSIVVYRIYKPYDDSAWHTMSAQAFVNEITAEGRPHLYRYVLNEPLCGEGDLPRLFDWLIEVMDRLADKGYKGVIGNFPPGAFEPAWYERGRLDKYLRAIGMYSQEGVHIAGYHEYTGILLPYGVGQMPVEALFDRNRVQPDSWVKADQLPIAKWNGFYPPYWHLLRSAWADIRAKEIGAPIAKKLITEFGWDRMPDMENSAIGSPYAILTSAYGVPQPHTNMRGVNTLKNVYRYYFPDMTFEQAVWEQLKWADSIYPDNYIGFNLFTWSRNSPDWDIQHGFDYSRLIDLHIYMSQYRKEIPPMATYPNLPPVSDVRWKEGIVRPANVSFNVRAQPTTSSAVVRNIAVPIGARLAPDAMYKDSAGVNWIPVLFVDGAQGWIHTGVIHWELTNTTNERTLNFVLKFPATDSEYQTVVQQLNDLAKTLSNLGVTIAF